MSQLKIRGRTVSAIQLQYTTGAPSCQPTCHLKCMSSLERDLRSLAPVHLCLRSALLKPGHVPEVLSDGWHWDCYFLTQGQSSDGGDEGLSQDEGHPLGKRINCNVRRLSRLQR